jgi:hypothetical protein
VIVAVVAGAVSLVPIAAGDASAQGHPSAAECSTAAASKLPLPKHVYSLPKSIPRRGVYLVGINLFPACGWPQKGVTAAQVISQTRKGFHFGRRIKISTVKADCSEQPYGVRHRKEATIPCWGIAANVDDCEAVTNTKCEHINQYLFFVDAWRGLDIMEAWD